MDEVASLGRALIEQFFEALDFCRIGVQATPAQVTLSPGAQQQFTAAVTGLIDPPLQAPPTRAASAWRR